MAAWPAHGTHPSIGVATGSDDAFSRPPSQYPTTAGDFLEAMAIDDLDGDGLKDLAIAESSHCQIEVMYGRCS
jgi:hypothetical protein